MKNKRKLISGRVVTDASKIEDMTISSKCPDKWLFVDLETGDVWHVRKRAIKGSSPYWRGVNKTEAKELGQVTRRLLRPENSRRLSKRQ